MSPVQQIKNIVASPLNPEKNKVKDEKSHNRILKQNNLKKKA